METHLDLQQQGNFPERRFLTNWPEKEDYFSERDAFIKKNKADVENRLKQAGYGDELVSDMSTVCLRGLYLFNLMSDVLKVEDKIDTSLMWEPQMHQKTRGQAVFVIDVVGEDNSGEPRSFVSLLDSAKKGKDLSLRQSQVRVNLERIKNEVVSLIRYEGRATELYKDKPEMGKEMRIEGLELLGIRTEKCIVEEVAHLLYVASMFKSKERTVTWLEQIKNYLPHLPGDDALIKIDTEEESRMREERYSDTEIENRARVLVKMFMNKYYPDFNFID